jgi:hypothetical protein
MPNKPMFKNSPFSTNSPYCMLGINTAFFYICIYRCLGLIATMKAFWKCCPFNKEIRGEIIMSLKKGTLEW